MISRATKAVMMLAAFAVFFALVCPIAPTPMAFQKHGSNKVSTAPIVLNAAIVVAFQLVYLQTSVTPSSDVSTDTNALNCVRNC